MALNIRQVQPADDAEIRRLVADQMNAICAKDLGKLTSRYTVDVVFYGYRPVLYLEGAEAVRRMWESCLAQLPDSLQAEMRDISLFGCSHDAIIACGRTHYAGVGFNLDGRHTALYRRVEGGWRVTSESAFLPFTSRVAAAEGA